MYPLWQVRERVSDGTGALSALQTFTESGLGRSRGTPCDRLHRVWFVFPKCRFGTALLDYIRLGKTEVMKIIRSRKRTVTAEAAAFPFR